MKKTIVILLCCLGLFCAGCGNYVGTTEITENSMARYSNLISAKDNEVVQTLGEGYPQYYRKVIIYSRQYYGCLFDEKGKTTVLYNNLNEVIEIKMESDNVSVKFVKKNLKSLMGEAKMKGSIFGNHKGVWEKDGISYNLNSSKETKSELSIRIFDEDNYKTTPK